MNEVVAIGRTVEVAKQQALRDLGVKSDDNVEFEVIDEGAKGFFRWGTKFARVRARLLEGGGGTREKKEMWKSAEVPPITVGERPLPTPVKQFERTVDMEKEVKVAEKPREKPREKPVTAGLETGPELLEEEESGPFNPREIIRNILNYLNIEGKIHLKRVEDSQVYSIEGKDLGVLIGKHGQTLEALQFIVNLILLRQTEGKQKITVDVEGYRERREKSLKELAQRFAEKAMKEKRNVVLEPMLPSERRIIHMALQENPSISTFSQGEEPMRKVIISPTKRSEQ